MNTIYRIVWNAATGKWVVASELAKGRKKKAARVAGFAAAMALALSFGGNVAMAATTNPGDACTMPSGADGTVDESGFCMTNAGSNMGVQSIGTMATVDDAMVKVNGTAPSIANGTNTIAIGTGARSDSGSGGDGNVAIGANATIQNTGAGAIVMGRNATIQGPGSDPSVTGAGSIAIGDGAKVYGNNAIAMGTGASAQQSNNIALGTSSSATGSNSTAVGFAANAGANNSVALGANTSATRDNTVAVGSRQVVNVSAGTQANDAVNVSQLQSVVTALGGGASINASTGAVTGPTYSVGGTTVNTVADAVTNLDGRTTDNTTNIANLTQGVANGTVGLVQQDASNNITVAAAMGGGNVDFTGTGGARTLSGVANGDVSSGSTQAVNGSQLYTTQQNVANNETTINALNQNYSDLNVRVTDNTNNINVLSGQIGSGTVGLVQQDAASGNITVAATKGGNVVSVSGADGARKVTGVADADLKAGSSDAVNGSQLNDTNQNVQANTSNIETLTTSYNALDGRVTTNTTNISDLKTQIGNGTVGLVQQDAQSGNITVAATTGGSVVDVSGTGGTRKVSGVADGTLSATSTDAVNGAQLNAIDQQAKANETNISTLNTSVTNLDGRVTANETNVTNLQTQIGNGAVGLVQQNASSGHITVAAGKGGNVVNVAGTEGARVVSGVANGTDDNDAVTIAQLKAVGLVDANGNPVAAITYDDATMATARLGGSFGTVIDNLAVGKVAAGSMQAVNGGQLYDMQQGFQSQFDSLNGQVGQLNDRVGAVEAGVANPGPGQGNGGGFVPAPGTGDNSLAVGDNANASGSNSAAVGNGASASGDNSSAIGNGAVASGNNGTAIGAGASATADNAVALGAGSVADRANSVSVGSAGNERQITNVAAGTAPTDAVNVQQLNDARDWAQSYTDTRANALEQKIDKVNRRANAGTAAAIAVANLPQAYAPGQSAVAAGVGTFNGQTAVSAGMSTISSDGRWVFKGSLVGNNRGDAGAGAGAAMVW